MPDQYIYQAPLTHFTGEPVTDSSGNRMFEQWRIVRISDGNCLIYGADAQVAVWVNGRVGGGLVEVPIKSVGILKPGIDPVTVNEKTLPEVLAGGAYFFNQQDSAGYSDVMVAVAADDIVIGTPDVVYEVLRSPFELWKVRRITAEIDAGNTRAVSQARQLGFKIEGRKRREAPVTENNPDGVVLVMGLLPDECPFWVRHSEVAA
jgi:hypothetical protein